MRRPGCGPGHIWTCQAVLAPAGEKGIAGQFPLGAKGPLAPVEQAIAAGLESAQPA